MLVLAAERITITSGISTYPAGTGAAMHSRNCVEHVTLLSGTGECVIDGVATALEPHGTTYVEAESRTCSATPARCR